MNDIKITNYLQQIYHMEFWLHNHKLCFICFLGSVIFNSWWFWPLQETRWYLMILNRKHQHNLILNSESHALLPWWTWIYAVLADSRQRKGLLLCQLQCLMRNEHSVLKGSGKRPNYNLTGHREIPDSKSSGGGASSTWTPPTNL